MNPQSNPSPPPCTGIPFSTITAAVFLLSFAVLVFEVALTRLFSVVLRYHFVFLVTSVAVCGLGVGGLILHQCQRSLTGVPARLVAFVSLCGFGLTTPLVILLILLWLLPNYPTGYAGVALLIMIPFLFAGVFLAYAFENYADRCGLLYGADLIGAAIAAGVVILLLKTFGAIDTCFVAGGLATVGGLVVFVHRNSTTQRWTRWGAVGGFVLVLNLGLLISNQRARFADIPPLNIGDPEAAREIAKPLFRELADPSIGAKIVQTDWSAFARTDVVEETDAPGVKYIWTDGEVPTHMEKFDGDLKKVEYLKSFIGYLPYHTRKMNRVLCIGPGGGLDALLGLVAGAQEIDGVEINPSIPEIMKKYSGFNGHIYEHPNVHIAVGDGRTFVRHSPKNYDLIYLALTQTATAGNVGLALVESYIHTTDALADYLQHLSNQGQMALITQEYSLLCRYFSSAVEVLGRNSTPQEACRHIALFTVPSDIYEGNPYRNLFLVQKAPFTGAQARRLQTIAQRMHLRALFIPYVYEGEPFGRLSAGELDLHGFVKLFRQYDKVNISPVTDDSPFFLDLSLAIPSLLIQLAAGALTLVVVFSVWSGLVNRVRSSGSSSPALPFVLYFTALGVGFMLIEVALAQKMILFLGYPTLALSVILCSLLLGGGWGSWFSQRLPVERVGRGILIGALGVVILVVVDTVVIRILFEQVDIPSIALRSVAGIALLLPLGFFLGIPFPSGVRMMDGICPRDIPWMWGVNGVMSVVGSVLAAIGAKLWGFNRVLLLGSCVYLGVALYFAAVVWRRSKSGES